MAVWGVACALTPGHYSLFLFAVNIVGFSLVLKICLWGVITSFFYHLMEHLCFLFVRYSPNNLLFLTDLFNHNIIKRYFFLILFYNHREPPKRFAHRLRWVHSVGRTQVLKDLDDAIPPESQWKAAPPEQKRTSADGELLKDRTKWNCWLCKAKIKQEPVKARSVLLLHSIYFGHSDYLATEMKKHVTYCLECVANGQPDIFFFNHVKLTASNFAFTFFFHGADILSYLFSFAWLIFTLQSL